MLFFAGFAQAGIYTCKDENGNTIYSDTPQACVDDKAEEVKVDSLPTLIQTKPVATQTSNETEEVKKKDHYQSLVITSPNKDETLRSNNGDLTISYQTDPALKTDVGHRYVVILNGKEIYRGKNASVKLEELDRGEYSVSAKIVTSNGKTLLESESMEFFLQRFSALQNGGANGGGNSP